MEPAGDNGLRLFENRGWLLAKVRPGFIMGGEQFSPRSVSGVES